MSTNWKIMTESVKQKVTLCYLAIREHIILLPKDNTSSDKGLCYLPKAMHSRI